MPVKILKSEIFEPRLFELPMNGKRLPIQNTTPFYPIYNNKENVLFEGDSIEWLKSLSSETVDLIFADPPYNIKKAEWDKFESQEKYIEWSMQWISESSRVLKKTGTLSIVFGTDIAKSSSALPLSKRIVI
jgi:site-specific DNA-methyltransferase (adenine-specific)